MSSRIVDETGTFMTTAQHLAQLKTQTPSPATPHEREQITGQGDIFGEVVVEASGFSTFGYANRLDGASRLCK